MNSATVTALITCWDSLNNISDSLKLVTFTVFPFRAFDKWKSALSKKMDNISLCAVVHYLSFRGSFKKVHKDL